ncbi:ATP-binding protein [Spirosoma pollinicola]|uniref:Histidine kinase n=1 Tax=Spirosoma pollinicola TaxID=2057025 RepID=A0A2K8YX00_9BACT|nr:ATP-binding protein [Spirosoma pollinicola]AUD02165.1 histidine kinase [Spirosoma pollinicola]
MNQLDQLTFKISTGLKKIIGRDLITDDFIAVFELVKNSYDAYAKNVNIIFNNDYLIIKDNGKGMSLEDLKNKWLFVAYSAKIDGTEDKEIEIKDSNYRDKLNKRYYAGAKGIGRFSSDKLGSRLRLITKQKGSDTIEQLDIDWGDFEEDSSEEFADIKVDHKTLPKEFYSDFGHGTTIEITELRSSWDRIKIKQLRHSLEKLINPFANSESDFSISIECKRELETDKKEKIARDKINGPIENFIFETLNVKTTQINSVIDKNFITTKLIDRGTPVYEIREPNLYYNYLEDVRYQLFFLNTAAKNNFTRQMGLEPIKFGSVFLFKNGFRVYPFGDPGDDELGMDHRKQQGYARFLGTRDLLGRIEIFTDDPEQFKEVSSRDGGLIETEAYEQLVSSFFDKCLKRLERYVVDVQWNYKLDRNLGDDKDQEDTNIIESSLGGRTQIIEIIKRLADNKEVEIISYNKDLINVLEGDIGKVSDKVFKSLIKIADKTEDNTFKLQVLTAEEKYNKLKQEKERSDREAEEERRKRKEAEAEAEQAKQDKEEAQRERQQAEKDKQRAELEAKEKELQRREEELKRKEAEQRAIEAEKKRILEEEARKYAEKAKEVKENQVRFLQSVKAIEYDDIRDLNHIIGINSDNIRKRLLLFKRKYDKNSDISKSDVLDFIKSISLANDKIRAIATFTTKGNFLKAASDTNGDIVNFIVEYFENIYQYLFDDFNVSFINPRVEFITHFKPIEISVVLDNLVSNSRKKKATKLQIEFIKNDDSLVIIFRDFGKPLDSAIVDWKTIFEEGVTTTNGSGLGLSHVNKIIKDMKGSISVNTAFKEGFELVINLPK